MEIAFSPYDLAGKTLNNRIVMAPMTRSRAQNPGALPTDLTALYYAQRASAGLIITEGIQPSVVGQGYPSTPGLHSQEQIDAWRTVTDAVHENEGIIFAQLMHAGRIGHADLLPGELAPVGPSPVKAEGQVYTSKGPQDIVEPKELTEEEIWDTIADFTQAARNAVAAGFDGVEIHGANGYLVHQFLSTNANLRTDEWGGSTQGRIRFGVEVAKSIAAAIGPDKVGIRISPANPFNSISEDDIEGTYEAFIKTLAELDLAYLHFMANPMQNGMLIRARQWWPNALIANTFVGDATKSKADLAPIENGQADLVSFGRLFISNPDLPTRLATDGPYNEADASKFYGGNEVGYTDYLTLASS
jgi:N-ethylmaleimide reductase